MNDVILACRNLSMQYQQGSEKITVFSGLEMEVRRGELIGIVGASGSGKTTLLNLLGGLDIPTGGEVLLDGISSAKLSENEKAALRNRALGFVYQFHHLLPEFTALENVAIPKFIARVPKKQALAEAAAILEQVGLGARLHHKPAALSGGERQRVAVARALVMQPACVLMDEPTGNLDVETAESIQALLLELNRTLGIAFVVVTHDLTLANRMGRVLAMQHGKLVERHA